jgi:hypothetical protein
MIIEYSRARELGTDSLVMMVARKTATAAIAASVYAQNSKEKHCVPTIECLRHAFSCANSEQTEFERPDDMDVRDVRQTNLDLSP